MFLLGLGQETFNATSLTPTNRASCPCILSGRRVKKWVEERDVGAAKLGEKTHKKNPDMLDIIIFLSRCHGPSPIPHSWLCHTFVEACLCSWRLYSGPTLEFMAWQTPESWQHLAEFMCRVWAQHYRVMRTAQWSEGAPENLFKSNH